jgi:transposase
LKLKQTKGMADWSDFQWEHIRSFVKWNRRQRQRPDGHGGRWSEARPVSDDALWILRTGAPRQDLPRRYGPYQTCHGRFPQWRGSGVLDGILWAVCEDLRPRRSA